MCESIMAAKKKEDANVTENPENMTVEAAFEQISSIVEQLDSDEVCLEDSLKLYKQGVQLLERCGRRLDQIEKEMIVLTDEGEMPDE
jgi:exodeoxyribonuclease VII small subunit